MQQHQLQPIQGSDHIELSVGDDDDDATTATHRQTPRSDTWAAAAATPRTTQRPTTTDNDDDADDWVPPTRDEWEALQRRAETATGQAAARRRMLKDHGINPRTGKPLQHQQQQQPATWHSEEETGQQDGLSLFDSLNIGRQDQQRRDQQRTDTSQRGSHWETAQRVADVERQYQGQLASLLLKDAFREAGWAGTDLSMAMRLIDRDELDLDEDDDGQPVLVGADEQIRSIAVQFPDWFRQQRKPRTADRTPALSDVDAGQPAGAARITGRPRGWRDQMSDQLSGSLKRRR